MPLPRSLSPGRRVPFRLRRNLRIHRNDTDELTASLHGHIAAGTSRHIGRVLMAASTRQHPHHIHLDLTHLGSLTEPGSILLPLVASAPHHQRITIHRAPGAVRIRLHGLGLDQRIDYSNEPPH